MKPRTFGHHQMLILPGLLLYSVLYLITNLHCEALSDQFCSTIWFHVSKECVWAVFIFLLSNLAFFSLSAPCFKLTVFSVKTSATSSRLFLVFFNQGKTYLIIYFCCLPGLLMLLTWLILLWLLLRQPASFVSTSIWNSFWEIQLAATKCQVQHLQLAPDLLSAWCVMEQEWRTGLT